MMSAGSELERVSMAIVITNIRFFGLCVWTLQTLSLLERINVTQGKVSGQFKSFASISINRSVVSNTNNQMSHTQDWNGL